MRLIDADLITGSNELVTKVVVRNFVPYIKVDDLIEFIDNLPTAYDVDKVVEQLKDYRSDFMADVYEILQSEPDNNNANHIIDMFDEAIAIVEAGGTDE